MENELNAPKIKNSFVEHPLIQAASGQVPVVGAITTLWVETVRSRRERELYTFLSEVASRINSLYSARESGLDVEHMASEDYATTLANVTELAVREKDESKREYLQRFLVNYGKTRRPDVDLRKIFYTFISDLSGMHLVLLDQVFAAQKALSDADIGILSEQLDKPEAVSIKSISTGLNLSEELVQALCAVLESRGLILLKDVPLNYDDSTQRLIMRPLARRFMEFMAIE